MDRRGFLRLVAGVAVAPVAVAVAQKAPPPPPSWYTGTDRVEYVPGPAAAVSGAYTINWDSVRALRSGR